MKSEEITRISVCTEILTETLPKKLGVWSWKAVGIFQTGLYDGKCRI